MSPTSRTDQTPAPASTLASTDALVLFFEAAARLYRASPWVVLGTAHDFEVHLEAWGVDAFFSLHGAPGHEPILFLFADRNFMVGPHHAITFERLEDLHPSIRERIARDALPIAGEDAVPVGTVLDDAWRVRAPLAVERDVATAVMFAVAAHVAAVQAERGVGPAAIDGGRYRVATARGEVEVRLAPIHVRPRFARSAPAGSLGACSPLHSAPDGTAPSGDGSSRRR